VPGAEGIIPQDCISISRADCRNLYTIFATEYADDEGTGV